MLTTPLHVRNDTGVGAIRAAATTDSCDGFTLHAPLKPAQIEAIDAVLARRSDFRTCINEPGALPLLERLAHIRYLQLYFTRGDDAVDLRPALRLPGVRALRLHAHWMHDCGFLAELSPELEALLLEETDRPKTGIGLLDRFKRLRRLGLHGPCKGYECIQSLTELEQLDLQSVGDDSYDFIRPLLRLRSLRIALAGPRNLFAVAALPELRYLELWMIKRLGDLAALSDCRALRWLELDSMPAHAALPDLSGLRDLTVVVLNSMNGLVDFRGLSRCPHLEVLLFAPSRRPAAAPSSFEPVLASRSLKHVSAGFGSLRLNDQFEALARAAGKSWGKPDMHRYRAAAIGR